MEIYETLHGAWTGRSMTIAEDDAWPSNWVTVAPPEPGENETPVWEVPGVWRLVTNWTPPEPPPLPVPTKVHKYWLTKVLEAEGEMDGIEDDLDALAAAGNRAPRREWQSASEVERANQLLNEFATARGWPSERVDGWFVQAAAYQAAAGGGTEVGA